MQLAKSSLGTTLLGFSSISFALPLYLLLLSGFPTVDALKVCTMIFAQIVSGSIIWAHVMHPRQVDIVEGVGMGLAAHGNQAARHVFVAAGQRNQRVVPLCAHHCLKSN